MKISQLEILPAIDVKDGRAVRLVQGELSATSTYGLPVEVASDFVSQGANWIHLVDLDDASLERALATGCNRVNLGTAAIENPEWTAKVISQYGEKIAVGLDVRGHTLATRGWTESGGDLFEMIAKLDAAGCSRYIVTDVSKDGTLAGPNLELLREVCAVTKAPIVASGGIAVLQDLIELRAMTGIGIEGAIVGKAIYSGAFTVAQALEVASK